MTNILNVIFAILLSMAGVSSAEARSNHPGTMQNSSHAILKVPLNDVTIAYRVAGPTKGDVVFLIPGIGMQLIEWPDALVNGLTKKGFRVIMLDMRDSGESTHFESAGQPDWGAFFGALQAGKKPPLAYSAEDMANDVLALMNVLKIEKARFLGISGGATITELIAISNPGRVSSMTLIAANSGNPAVPIPAKPEAFAGQPQPKPDETFDEAVARKIGMDTILAGANAPSDKDQLRLNADRVARRDRDPFATLRQGAALLALGDIRARLKQITTPTSVIHGSDDPLIPAQLGREVAEVISSAQFHELERMGHNLPAEQIPFIVETVTRPSKKIR
jgi:pimeloyl-ACP methyl ester carboxylesterase